MKRFPAVLVLCLVLLAVCAAAEILLPSYESYVDQAPEVISAEENAETFTGRYYTDMDSVSQYRGMLQESGFLLSGQWELPGGEGYSCLHVYAYTWMGAGHPAAFRMTVGENSFSAHLLIQAAELSDGRVLLGLTASTEISRFEYVKPTPTPEPTPSPTPLPAGYCTYCDHGKCRECRGTGQKRCGICSGSGICPTCNGRRRFYVTGYGVGAGTYVDCQGCHGDGQCWRCHGARTESCGFCNGGVCPFCHGNYTGQ